MWNKRREDEPSKSFNPPGPASAPVSPSSVEPKKETTTVSMPVGRTDAGSTNAASIGKAVKISGQSLSKGDLYAGGDGEGIVEAPEHRLTIGPNGTVHSPIKAREVVALGSIQGNVEASERIEIRKDAKLIG